MMTHLTYDQAVKAGYISYAGPYKEEEKWMLEFVLTDIYENRRDLPALVETNQGIDIYIKPNIYPHPNPYVRTDD